MTDDDLLRELQLAMDATDPPPGDLRDLAIRALAWNTEAAQLLDTTYDSALTVSRMRSGTAPRDLTFARGALEVECTIELLDTGASRISGVARGAVAEVILFNPGRSPEVLPHDEAGVFVCEVPSPSVAIGVRGENGDLYRSELISSD